MKFYLIHINLPLVFLIISFTSSNEFANRRGRPHKLPKTPPIQFMNRPLKFTPLRDVHKKSRPTKKPILRKKNTVKVKPLKDLFKPASKKQIQKPFSQTKLPVTPPVSRTVPKIQNKQLQLVARPRPIGFPFRLSTAFLIPAIPTFIGNAN